MRPRHGLPRAALVLAAVASLGAASSGRVPWPFGVAPSSTRLRELTADAVALAARSRLSEVSGTKTRGEELESTQVLQSKLDEERLDATFIFHFGDEFFEHSFRRDSGLGGLVEGPRLHRVHRGAAGGLDTFSCAGCHSVGGPDGAGAATQSAYLLGDGEHLSTANVRNPPALLGVGLLQELGVEMTAELARQRDQAIAAAAASHAPSRVALASKGVRFGVLAVDASGAVDTSGVRGVSSDLVVRPFGWKGSEARLRRMVEEAARIHFGAQSTVLAQRYREAPDVARLGAGPSWWDPDGDGVPREVEEGTLSAAAAYLTMLETPVLVPPSRPSLLERWAEGDALFTQVGCDGCHVRVMHLDNTLWEERSDTTKGPPIRVRLLEDGEAPRGNDQVMLFSDLARHDMGDALADRNDDPAGIPRGVFLTRPLWGLAETAPYLHDGRAPAIPDAILAHGGEAQAARDAFAALSPAQQASLHVFLLSLSRQPKVRSPR